MKTLVSRGRLLAATAALCIAMLPFTPAIADENYFGYVYGAETLPKGRWEAYQWVTARLGKEAGSYTAFDLRTEVETGLTDKLQLAFYLNSRAHEIEDVPGLEDRSSFAFQGVSTELKYRLKSPYLDGYGFAFYVEPGYSRIDKIGGEVEEEIELELKAIFQKNFMDDTVVWAVNYTLEPEWVIGEEVEEHAGEVEEGEGLPGGDEAEEEHEAKKELAEELTTGLSVRFAPRWFLGAELRAHSEWPDFSHREHLALFLGPTIHYGAQRWWWTLTYLPQLWGHPDGSASNLQLDEHERSEIRLKVGLNF